MNAPLRIQLRAEDTVRRQGLAAMLAAAGHNLTQQNPDIVLVDLHRDTTVPDEAEAPVVVLTDHPVRDKQPAGVLPRQVSAAQLDAALRAAVAGLIVRTPGDARRDGFRPAVDDPPLLTPREAEVLTLVGQGMSNKAVARALGISVHTVKFHLEALFAKLDATSRAEAVAKGLRDGVIEL
jgi:DNA-binding NarL/FixJ family response regulator